MRGNAELVLVKNIYCLTAVVVLASSLVGSASGSCLSYGHSCWGAHGKRSGGNIGGGLRPLENNVGIQDRRLPALDERWLLSRLVNRQLMQVPLVARLHARILDEDPAPDSTMMEKFDRDNVIRDLAKNDRKLRDDEPDNMLIPEQRDFSNDQAIKAGLYKILRNIE